MPDAQIEIALKLVDQATAPIRTALSQMERSLGRLQRATQSLNRSFHLLLVAFGSYKVLDAFSSAISRSIRVINDYNTSVASMAALTFSFMEKQKGVDLATQYQQAVQYARDLAQVTENLAAKTLLTGEQARIMVTEFLKAGQFIDTANQRQIQALQAIANAVYLITGGYDVERQLITEIGHLLQGQITAQDRLGKVLLALDPQLKEHLKIWVQERTVIENVGKLLKGFSYATKDVAKQWGTVRSTTQTIVDQILRTGMKPLYSDLVYQLERLNKFLNEHKHELSTGVKGAYEGIKNVLKTIFDYWKGTRDWNQVIADTAASTVGVVGALTQAVLEFKYALVSLKSIKIWFESKFREQEIKNLQATIENLRQTAAELTGQKEVPWYRKMFEIFIPEGGKLLEAQKNLELANKLEERVKKLIEEQNSALREQKEVYEELLKIQKTISELQAKIKKEQERIRNLVREPPGSSQTGAKPPSSKPPGPDPEEIAKQAKELEKLEKITRKLYIESLPEGARLIAEIHKKYDDLLLEAIEVVKAGYRDWDWYLQLASNLSQREREEIEKLLKKHQDVAKETLNIWEETFSVLEDLLEDWIYHGKIKIEDLAGAFREVFAEIASAWITDKIRVMLKDL